MFPQYQMIRDFDLYENDFQETNRFSAPVFHKEDFLKETQDNELETQKINFSTRSFKSKTFSIQTSFERNIMDQHLLAFKKILQKYMENCFPNFKKVYQKSLINQIYQLDEVLVSGEQKIRSLINKDQQYFQEREKKLFLTDLSYQQKFNEFLTFVANNTPAVLTVELVFVANLFWQAYLPKQQTGLSEAQIKSLIDELLESENSENYLQKLRFLNFKDTLLPIELDQRQLNDCLKTFMRQFGNTILLVIEEYFYNPYAKENEEGQNLKRALNFKDISNDQFSDDEEEINLSLGNKKRKI